jgi:hypothetical protein
MLYGVAPTLAAAIDKVEGEAEGTAPANLHLYRALVSGEMVMDRETRCELSTETVRVHPLRRTLARTADLHTIFTWPTHKRYNAALC